MSADATLVHVSDSHGGHRRLPALAASLLVHGGDLCRTGRRDEILDALDWMAGYPCAAKALVPGNHDHWIFAEPAVAAQACRERGIALLAGRGEALAGLSVYGFPWVPYREAWGWPAADRAYCLPDGGPELAAACRAIPDGVELLACHAPPYGLADAGPADGYWAGLGLERAGSRELRGWLDAHPRLPLLLCGHVHDNPGLQAYGATWLSNAAGVAVEIEIRDGRLRGARVHV